MAIQFNEERVRKQVIEAPDEVFAIIAEEVDRRRDAAAGKRSTDISFEEKLERAIKTLNERDLGAWIAKMASRGDPAGLSRIMEIVERIESTREAGNLCIQIVPYTVKDSSIAEIIRRGPDELYGEWEKAMIERAVDRDPEGVTLRLQGWIEQVNQLCGERAMEVLT